MNNSKYIEEDEIDLVELWKIIIKRKVLILSFIFLITIISVIYVNIKTYTPIYSGSLLVEIGEIKTQNSNKIYFDNPHNLKNVIKRKFLIEVEIPKLSNNLLIIKVKNIKKDNISVLINKVYDFILDRHNEKTKLYKNYIMTKTISDIKIEKEAINKPNKKLIITVSFITSLILSLFIIFFIEFITKKEESGNNE